MAKQLQDDQKTVFRLPTFIRVRSDGDGGLLFDFWLPDNTGQESTGADYFADALTAAKHYGSPNILIWVTAAIRLGGAIGPVESGFLRELVSAAMRGRVPDEIPPRMVEVARQMAGEAFPPDWDIEYGLDLAKTALAVSRSEGTEAFVWQTMLDVAEGRNSLGATGFLWAICNAAYAGQFH